MSFAQALSMTYCRKSLHTFPNSYLVSQLPREYKDALTLTDKVHGFLDGRTDTYTNSAWAEDWTPTLFDTEQLPREGYNLQSENLYAHSDEHPMIFQKGIMHSTLIKRISNASLLENLTEVFGPEGLSPEDDWTEAWNYKLVHNSGNAKLEFMESRGLPRVTFFHPPTFRKSPDSKAPETAINNLISKPVWVPINEADFRQRISGDFMLRDTDKNILQSYNYRKDAEDWETAIELQEEYRQLWDVQFDKRLLSGTSKLVTWSSVDQAVDLIPNAPKSPEPPDDFNTRISPQLLLLRLLVTFGGPIWRDENTLWGMTLHHDSDCWLQISNRGGYLSLEYDGPDSEDDKVKSVVSYLISTDIIHQNSGTIVGTVA